jgi:hypothetical protein
VQIEVRGPARTPITACGRSWRETEPALFAFCRDRTLADIRSDALLFDPSRHPQGDQPPGASSSPTGVTVNECYLAVSKDGKRFMSELRSKDGFVATKTNEAAEHVYAAFGKSWRGKILQHRKARKLEKAVDKAIRTSARARDQPGPCIPANLEGLRSLHAHRLVRDRDRTPKELREEGR